MLRVLAVAISAFSMAGSTQYVLSHPRNPAAPLLPPAVDPVETDPMPTEMTVVTARPTATPRPTSAATTAAPAAASTAAAAPTATQRVAVVVTLPPSAPSPARTAAPTPAPTVRIAASVRATQLPRVTTTHSS